MCFLYLISCLINIISLLNYNRDTEEFDDLTNVVEVLAIIMMVSSFILLIFWFAVKYPTIRRMNWEKYYLTNSRK